MIIGFIAPLLPNKVLINNIIEHRGNVRHIPTIMDEGIPILSKGTQLLNFAAIPKQQPLNNMTIKLENNLTI